MLWKAPISDPELKRIRAAERALELKREHLGLPRYLAETPACRHFGPLRQLFDLQGAEIPDSSNLHPFGPKKRKYWRDDFSSDDDVDHDSKRSTYTCFNNTVVWSCPSWCHQVSNNVPSSIDDGDDILHITQSQQNHQVKAIDK